VGCSQRSEKMRPRTTSECSSATLLMSVRVCLPFKHGSQGLVGNGLSVNSIPVTIPLRSIWVTVLWLRCPSRLCHISRLAFETFTRVASACTVMLLQALRPDVGRWVTLSPRYWAGRPSITDGGRAPYSAVLNCDPSWSSKLVRCLS